ncbi:MAG: response regulator transcription factor [Myxococcales bacterium]|nr:response regulator transcription factor [Myxococcales bacterium]
MIRVFLADDHAVVRMGLRALLATAPDVEVVGEACHGRQVLEAAEADDWTADVLLLDLSLPRVSGIEVLTRLAKLRPTLRVLVLSMYAEEQYADHVARLGAAGYVAKDRSEEELLTAVRTVAQGRSYFSRRPNPQQATPLAGLSTRQFQVFSLVVAGHTVSEIAAELNVGVSTVSTHLGQVKLRLGVHSVAELVAYAHRLDLA